MIFKHNPLNRIVSLGLSYTHIAILVSLSLLATIMEVFSIGIFLPIIQFIKHNGDINELTSNSDVWVYVVDFFGTLNTDISLLILVVVAFSFFLIRQLLVYTNIVYRSKITQNLILNIRKKMFNKYLLSDISYQDRMAVGDLVNIMTTEASRSVIGVMTPVNVLVYIIMVIGYLFVLVAISWELTLISIFVITCVILLVKIWIDKSIGAGRKLVGSNAKTSKFLVQRLRLSKLIKLSLSETSEMQEFYKLVKLQKKYELYKLFLKAKTESILEPLVIGTSLLFIYSSYTFFHIQIEVIGIYLLIILRLVPVAKQIVSQWQRFNSVLGSIEAVENFFRELKNNKEVDCGLIDIEKFQLGISFNNVFYKYPSGNSNALNGVSTYINKGEITAIVGPSGSGKSTFVDLIPQLKKISSGLVLIDNHSIEDYTLESLRRLISHVPQQPQIFSRTISDHIRYGNIKTTNEEIKEAANIAGIEEFIEGLDDKYDTMLGEDAITLSGGQKQRLDLARAIVKNTPILILDEATSNLDAKSEDLLRNAFINIKKQKNITIIVIAHRLSSIVDSDKIIVLKDGIIESEGKHRDLLNSNSWYQEAWILQHNKFN